jgi:rapamycin-insensitive companion of mTOR
MSGVDGRFLATSVGFHYLTEIGYIDQEIDDWFHGRNEEFVRSLEANYERSLHADDDDIERYQFLLNRVLKVVHSPGSYHSTFMAN